MKLPKYRILRLTAALAVLVMFTLTALGIAGRTVFTAKLQFVPALLRTIAGVGAGAVTLVVLLLIAAVAGRWYCSLFCPLGIFIDLIDLLPIPGKKALKKDFSFWQRGIALFCIVLALCGVNGGFLLLDPYSNFFRMTGEFSRGSFGLGALLFLLFTIFLAIRKRRFYCTAICPAGGCFNLFSRIAPVKLAINERCVKCRKCENICPAGCIDVASGSVDNARCIRCLNCLDACKFSALGFTLSRPGTPKIPENPERREFIKRSSAAVGGAVAGGLMIKLGMEKFAPAQAFSQILPPGAGSMGEFAKKCTSCLICVQNCPQEIIRPAKGGDGPVSLDLNGQFCLWECNMCSAICPMGAIAELNLPEKQHTQIAHAKIDSRCIGCTQCVAGCPAHAMVINDRNLAEPDLKRCVGCGKCATLCPVKAISIVPVAQQTRLQALPEPGKKTQTDNAPSKAFINAKECFSCGSCAEVCPVKAITPDENDTPKPVDETKCIGCGKCVKVCPARAITLK